MRTIFAATDFTGAAHNACEYAASLARQFKARLVLFSAYEPVPFPAAELPIEYQDEEISLPTELGLAKAVESIRSSHHDIKIEILCREGIIINEIISAARETGADMIVVGVKDKGKGLRKVFGSTITALARKTELPVIAVPENIRFVKLDTLALANDQDMDADTGPELLDMLIELGQRFSSKLYLVRVAKNQFQESYEISNPPLRLINMVKELEPVYKCFAGRNEEVALNEFVRKHNVNMLALLPHHHSIADRLFARSTTRTMIFDSRIPLLILPGLRIKEEQ